MKWPLLILIGLLATPVFARAGDVNIETHVLYRPRLEVSHRTTEATDFFVSHRARISFAAATEPWKIYIEPQDVRLWGAESSTVEQRGNVDVHQAFAEYKLSNVFQARLGRQEIIFLNHRLVGNLDWVQTGRSFDALRLSGTHKHASYDFFAAPLSNPTKKQADPGVAALLLRWTNAGRTLALLGISDWNPGSKEYRWTGGPYSEGKLLDPLTYRIEAYWQQGHKPGSKYHAYLVSGELGAAPTLALKPTLALGYDRASGTQASTNQAVFNTLFATNHKFYGYMDYFVNLPVDTSIGRDPRTRKPLPGRGLQDVYAVGSFMAGSTHVQLAGHRFLTEQKGTPSVFGTEVDLVATHKISSTLSAQAGYAVMFMGDALRTKFPKAPENATWGYAMLTAGL